MANGLVDPVFTLLPNKIDSIRRSSDPAGTAGSLQIQRGHLTVAGKAVTLRRSLPVSPGHLTVSGRAIGLNKRLLMTRGHLTLAGKSQVFAATHWNTVPDFVVDTSQTSPRFVPNIRVNYLFDPGTGTTVALDPLYDASQRVNDVNNALPSISELGTLISGATTYLAGDLYGQYGPVSPAGAATVVFADFGNRTVTFTTTPAQQPALVGSIRASLNAVGPVSVPISTLPGIAAGQVLTMVVFTANALTTAPDTQGWTLRGSDQTTSMMVYVYTKVAVASESNVLVAHASGKLNITVENWSGADTTSVLDAAPVFSTSSTLFTTPAITPTQDNCAVVTVIGDTNNPPFTSAPSGYTLIDQFFNTTSTVFWTGAAYKVQTTAANTGTLTWDLTNVGGQKAGVTFAIRGAPAVGAQTVTIPMRLLRGGVTYQYDLEVAP